MLCNCDIKLLFSQGCKCGGFQAEQAAKVSGSSAIASARITSGTQEQVLVAGKLVTDNSFPGSQNTFRDKQDQVLVRGRMSGSTYWIRFSDTRTKGFVPAIVDTPAGHVFKIKGQRTTLDLPVDVDWLADVRYVPRSDPEYIQD